MKENIENMTFEDYYLHLKDSAPTLREKVCHALEISYKTFYNKRNDNSWTNPEREMIAQILGQPVNVLFPEKQTA
jgi:hypothetical protein